jgi:hypothetical protein
MTKKHFIALADRIRDFEKWNEPKFTVQQIEMLASFCQSQNPYFNRERWLGYIAGENGPSGGKVGKVAA